MKRTHFHEVVENLRRLGKHLVPLNWPRNDQWIENEIGALKRGQVVVDGYDVIIKFNRAEYFGQEGIKDYILETFQMTGKDIPFLPFCLVVKMGKQVLGKKHLSLVEFFQDNRKVYCWSICLDRNNQAIIPPFNEDLQRCTYEGFEYAYINSSELSFY